MKLASWPQVRFIRDGRRLAQEVRLRSDAHSELVPGYVPGNKPRYLLISGLVFTQLTMEYLYDEFGTRWEMHAPSSFIEAVETGDIDKLEAEQEVVILSHVMLCGATKGYEEDANMHVRGSFSMFFGVHGVGHIECHYIYVPVC